jgi:hypothetical protein
MDEIFNYLGCIVYPLYNSAMSDFNEKSWYQLHGFLHMQMNPMTVDEIIELSGHIMNTMINEKLIQNHDKVIIFTILGDASILPILVDHINFISISIPHNLLNDLFHKFLSIDRHRDPIYTIIAEISEFAGVNGSNRADSANGVNSLKRNVKMLSSYYIRDDTGLDLVHKQIEMLQTMPCHQFQKLQLCHTYKFIPYLITNKNMNWNGKKE